MTDTNETDTDVVDCRPDHANADAFSPMTMGDPQVEYGVVDLDNHYPAETTMWQPEYPRDAPKEKHLTVPFEVVARGFTSRRAAKKAAEHRDGNYKAVMLSDTRGL